jgi:hypothetical protein
MHSPSQRDVDAKPPETSRHNHGLYCHICAFVEREHSRQYSARFPSSNQSREQFSLSYLHRKVAPIVHSRCDGLSFPVAINAWKAGSASGKMDVLQLQGCCVVT